MKKTVQLFKALSEEVRVRIMALLLDGELCVCDLMAVLKLPQSTVSRHLAYLKRASWVEGERRGAWMYYRLPAERNGLLGDLLKVLADHLVTIPMIMDDRQTLQDYLKTKSTTACDTLQNSYTLCLSHKSTMKGVK